MKIAVILPSLINKAPIQVAKDIVDYLLLNNCEVVVFYFDDKVELEFNCSTVKIGLLQKINFNHFDIIHSHMLRPDFYTWFYRKRIKAITISTLHNDIEKVLHDYYNTFIATVFTKLWIMFLRPKDKVVFLSNFAMQFNQKFFRLRNTHYIYNGRSVPLNSNDIIITKKFIQIINDYKVLGVIANISKIKGIGQIIDALRYLPDYCLVIIGEGPERKLLERKVQDNNLNERCMFLGYKPNAHQYMKYFDIYIMSSYSEGFPLVLIEAAQYAKPVVCSNLPIFREFFNENEVEFFELDNIESLIKSITRAFKKRNILSNLIYAKYLENYTQEKMGEKYLNLFQKLLNSKKNTV